MLMRSDARFESGIKFRSRSCSFIYLMRMLMLLHVLDHNQMCIFPYQVMASIRLYHSYIKDIRRSWRATLRMRHTRNMNRIIRNVFLCILLDSKICFETLRREIKNTEEAPDRLWISVEQNARKCSVAQISREILCMYFMQFPYLTQLGITLMAFY